MRHQENAVCELVCDQLEEIAREICKKREVSLEWLLLQEHKTIPCPPVLTKLLEQAIEQLNYPLLSLPSGAGHDGVTLSELTSIAMLFVRCRGGISHNPAKSVTVEDVDVALHVLEKFILLLSAKMI